MIEPEKKISQIVCDACQIRLKGHLRNESIPLSVVRLKPIENTKDKWLSLILVSCFEVQISFKVYFTLEDIENLMRDYMTILPSEISTDIVYDFMNEYCNLTAGMIQQTLSSQSIKVSISIPMISKGFDDVIFSTHDEGVFSDSWSLMVGPYKLTCISEIHILDREMFKDFLYTPAIEHVQNEDDIFNF